MSSIDRELALQNKLHDYAAIAVQECWVVQPVEKNVTVLSPSVAELKTNKTFGEDDVVVSEILPDIRVAVRRLLRK